MSGSNLLCAGVPADVVITPYDSYGNAGASGGRFAAELMEEHASEDGSPRTISCDVTESSSGQCLNSMPAPDSHACRDASRH